MKIKNSIPLKVPISSYLSDDLSLYLFNSSSGTDILTLEPETMDSVNFFSVEAALHNFYQPCIDEDCIYFPTRLGQILILDKQSGAILATADTKLPIMSDIHQDDQNVYCICGVPISKKLGLASDHYCVCIHDKQSGSKQVQTNYFDGEPAFMIVADDGVLVVAGAYLLRYNNTGEQTGNMPLSTPPDYSPILTDDFVILTYKNGHVRVLNRDSLKHYKVLKGPENISGAIRHDNVIFWMSPKAVCRFDYRNQVFDVIKSNRELSASIAVSGDGTNVFGCSDGNLLEFNWEDRQIEDVKLAKAILQDPLIFEKHLFIASEDHFHQVEI